MYKITLETLSEERLKNSVDQEILAKGKDIFQSGAVDNIEVTDLIASCTVHDIRRYHVEIKVAKKHLYLKCNCSHASRGLICEHEAAAWLAIREYLNKQLPPAWRPQLLQIIHSIPKQNAIQRNNRYSILCSLQQNYSNLYGKDPLGNWCIYAYTIQESNLPDIFHQSISSDTSSLNINLDAEIINHVKSRSAPILKAQRVIQHLDPSACMNEDPNIVSFANLISDIERLEVININYPLHDCLQILLNTRAPLFKGTQDDPFQFPIRIIPEPGEIRININKKDQGIQISPIIITGKQKLEQSINDISIINDSPTWILVHQKLVRLLEPSSLKILSSFNDPEGLFIEQSHEKIFQEKYFLELSSKIPIESNFIEREVIETQPNFRIYLDDDQGELQAQLRFVYQDFEVSYLSDPPEETIKQKPGSWTLVTIKRQAKEEQQSYEQISSKAFGLKRIPASSPSGKLRLRARVHPVDFLLNTVPQLIHLGYEVIGEKELTMARVNRNKPNISFDVSSGIDWFDVKTIVSFGELEVSLKDFRKAIQKNHNYIILSDGTIGEIPEEWFDKYKHLINIGKTRGDHLRFAHHQITILDDILEGEQAKKTDQKYLDIRENIQKLRTFEGIQEKSLAKGFQGELRPYQKAGYDWLHFLQNFSFGGCLADDMGLGKTIQALAFLISIYEDPINKISASLLVVPRSLIINWQREINHFVPGLRVLEYYETNRQKETDLFDQVDLIITTYGILLRDIEFLHSYKFHYAILDESQAIKNPTSQTARAAHLIDSSHKLVLTGTPIENSTSELWSQFAFLNPGLLGSHRYFKKEFSNPIEKEGDQESVENLRKIIFPFILRRTKNQVAPELPPRSEKIIYCDMEIEQRERYNQTRDYFRGVLLGMFESEGISKSRFKILEGLLRLRQISNHPQLVDKTYAGESGKFGLLLDTLETLKAEGHKALVFSQFVQMLKLVRKDLDEKNITYTYLDGATKNRQEQVDIFQKKGDIPFFLISLKAGGLGLNLTAADYVIHIDPWWNPAVELQASDRTHRIGQDKPVFVFKLISRDSVEEKILTLQERKRNLVDQIITTESSFFKSLTREEIESLFTD
jgi:non-specific serine/threonine protein kinase